MLTQQPPDEAQSPHLCIRMHCLALRNITSGKKQQSMFECSLKVPQILSNAMRVLNLVQYQSLLKPMRDSSHASEAKPRWHMAIQLLVYAAYFVIFLSLVLYSIMAILYINKPTPAQRSETKYFESHNLTAIEVACAFPGSGQYGLTMLSTYVILLVFTVVLRHHQWLAAGITASALTYSGVAAIHLVVLGMAYGRSIRSWPCYGADLGFPGEDPYTNIPICAGVFDPDTVLAVMVVGAGLLAALPMAMWSSTFRRAAARPVLVMWTLLLALGHMIYYLIVTDEHRHYQICPAGTVEPLPGDDYIAVPFDADWASKLYNIAGKVRLLSDQGSGNLCIYSCFASDGYVGRKANEIGIYPAHILETDHRSNATRNITITYWILYVILSIIVIVMENGHWSTWERSPAYIYTRRATQLISVSAYIAFVIWNAVLMDIPMSESFSSVGQWNVVAIIILVAVAAVAGRIVRLRRTRPAATEKLPEKDTQDWSIEIGYAS